MHLKHPVFNTLVIAAVFSLGAQAACLSDAQVESLAQHYLAKTLADNLEGLSDADGACTRAKFNVVLAKVFGKVLGYKAGLTNPAVQKRFSTDKPVWGKLYTPMLLQSGATVDAKFGSRPLYEADLLVRVKSADINHAKTPIEVLAAIDQIVPFIELPDGVVQDPPKLNGAGISAINVGARLGVAGRPLAVPDSPADRQALIDALRDMSVVVTEGDGATLAQGKGADLLGHPLNAVIWLASALAQEELALKAGDLISLGSFTALLAPRAGQSVTVTYKGLAGATPVQVTFK